MTSPLRAALGVDVGTTNTKIVLVALGTHSEGDEGNAHAARVLRGRTVPTPADGEGLVTAVLDAIAQVTAGDGEPGVRVEAVGIASMAETGALLDRDGVPLGALLRWNGDTHARTSAESPIHAAVAAVGADALYRASGVPIPAKTPMAHLLRLRSTGDARIGRARWAGVADLLALHLTGAWVTDHTLAARTMAYRLAPLGSPLATTFDADLLAVGSWSADRMPAVLEPGAPAGALTATAAARTGLTAGVPVFIAGHDHAVGAWAAGSREHGAAADSVGTAEALYRVSATAIPRDAAARAGMSIGRTVDGTMESLLAGNPTAGAIVDWAFASLFPGADRAATLASAARAAATWAGEPLVLPYLRGRQSPAPDPDAVFRVLARSGDRAALPADPGAALTAVLGGLVLQLAWMDQAQDAVIGSARDRTARPLAVLGGPGAADDAWWTLKQALIPGGVAHVAAAEPVGVGAALLALHRLTGQTHTIPLAARPSATGPAPDAAAMLADFVAAATT